LGRAAAMNSDFGHTITYVDAVSAVAEDVVVLNQNGGEKGRW
jgi:hypothetical protein